MKSLSEHSENSLDHFESRSILSTTSTIPPDEIKKRLKKQMAVQSRKQQSKRCVAKGEANAVTRSRRENTNNIKQNHGIWEDWV